MRFRVGELVFSASVVDTSQAGLTIQFRAPKIEMHEQLLLETRQRTRGGVFSLDDSGAEETEWRVVDSGFTYVGSEPWGMHHHSWRIEQIARLEITALVLGPLRLEPYDYREEMSEVDQLRLAARAAVSDSQLAVLSSLSVVDVVREGISPEPRRMRLEGYVWGPGAHGQAVAVVCADLAPPRATLAQATLPPLDVLELLLSKGILERAELHAARRVDDLDAWAL